MFSIKSGFSQILKPRQGPVLTVCQELLLRTNVFRIGLNSQHPFGRDSSKANIKDVQNDTPQSSF